MPDMQRFADQPDAHTIIMQGTIFMQISHGKCTFTRHIMLRCPLIPMPSSDHRVVTPLACLLSKRADKAQGQRGGGIGLHAKRRGICASAIVRAGERAHHSQPIPTQLGPWEPFAIERVNPGCVGES